MNVKKLQPDSADPGEDDSKRPPRLEADRKTADRVKEADEQAVTKDIDKFRQGTSERVKTVKVPDKQATSADGTLESFAQTQADLDKMQSEYLALLTNSAQKEVPMEAIAENFHKKIDAQAKAIAKAKGKALAEIYKGSPEASQARTRITKGRTDSLKGYAAAIGAGTVSIGSGVGKAGGYMIKEIGIPAANLMKEGIVKLAEGGAGVIKFAGKALRDVVGSLWSTAYDMAGTVDDYNKRKAKS